MRGRCRCYKGDEPGPLRRYARNCTTISEPIPSPSKIKSPEREYRMRRLRSRNNTEVFDRPPDRYTWILNIQPLEQFYSTRVNNFANKSRFWVSYSWLFRVSHTDFVSYSYYVDEIAIQNSSLSET